MEDAMGESDTRYVDQEQEDKELKELLRKHPEEDYCFQTAPFWALAEECPGPEPDPEKRVNIVNWCKCYNCSSMKSFTESICCCELDVMEDLLAGNLTSVTQHE